MPKSLIGIALFCAVFAGCGSSDQMQTAKVTGKVTFDGQPVTEGELLFAPSADGDEPGKPGAAQIQPDGSFVVSTYGDGDGAVIGTHTVSFTPPPARPANESSGVSSGQPSEPAGKPIPSAFVGLVPEQESVEVASGKNDFEIKLVKP